MPGLRAYHNSSVRSGGVSYQLALAASPGAVIGIGDGGAAIDLCSHRGAWFSMLINSVSSLLVSKA